MKRPTKTKPKCKRKARATPDQNWAQRMEAARLNHMADQLLGIPPTYGARTPNNKQFNPSRVAPLPVLMLGDIERWQLADYLRSLTKPAVLRALQRARTRTKKRGPKTDGARLWKAALEMQVSKRPKDTAYAWKLSPSRLYEIHAQLTKRQRACVPGHWRWWAAYELRKFRYAHRDISPSARRAAFIEELRTVR
ncbi:MAG: hypothetical protein M0038_04960 [Pseudomonadota bacterium]|jgi:hypothetical protein|nr:hypothetical protein [Pseudomonadota bacterium]